MEVHDILIAPDRKMECYVFVLCISRLNLAHRLRDELVTDTDDATMIQSGQPERW